MKQSVILDIFNGVRGHRESMEMPNEIRKELSNEVKLYEQLQKKLSPELFELLTNYSDATNSHLCEEVDFFFVEGFKLGVRIGIECMED